MHKPPLPATLAKHGVTEEQWWLLYHEQGGLCGVCLKWHEEYVIDHDHKRGQQRVRGLVGRMCNRQLGQIRDNAEWCYHAALYLQNPPSERVDSLRLVSYPVPTRSPKRRRTGGTK